MKNLLKLELVPRTSFGNNLRALMSRKEWDTVRKLQYKLAGGVCEICGAKGKDQGRRWDLECHERWDYDDRTHTQTLAGLIALCPFCHEVCHFGHTQIKGRANQALHHLMQVNECTLKQASLIVGEAQIKWLERSIHKWTLELSWLERHGIEIPTGKPKKKKRVYKKRAKRRKKPRPNLS